MAHHLHDKQTHQGFILVEEAAVPAEADAAIREFLRTAFPRRAHIFTASRHWRGSVPAYTLLHRWEHSVVAHVGVVMRTIRAGTTPLNAAGLQNLAIAPVLRRTGLLQSMTRAALDEAARRNAQFGLLFCPPDQELFFTQRGWKRLRVGVVVTDEFGRPTPFRRHAIPLCISLAGDPLPPGDIDLQGPEW